MVVGKNDRKKFPVRESFLHSVQNRCSKLKELEFMNCTLDYNETPFRKLPKSLEIFRLKKIVWTNLPFIKTLQSSPFFKLKKRLPFLKTVRMTFTFYTLST